jgi:hypothetical protein
MTEPHTNIEGLQAQRTQTAEDATREAAVRQALGHLDPKNDDQQQGYVEILRRLQTAIDRELSKWTSAPTQPVGPSGTTAVAEPQQAPEPEA